MNLFLLSAFIASSLALIDNQSEPVDFLAHFFFWICLICLVFIAKIMVEKRHFYLAMFVFAQTIIFSFFFYVYVNSEQVLRTTVYVFEPVFNHSYLKIAVNASLVALIAIVATYSIYRKNWKKGDKINIVYVAFQLLEKFALVPNGLGSLLIFLSFLVSLTIFSTSITILEMPYPFNTRINWFPAIYYPLLYSLVFIPYIVFFAKGLSAQFANTPTLLFLARLNLIISPILLLFTYSSRGLMTVIFFIVGLLELSLARKKRGSWIFGIIYLALSWYLYQSFTYVRFHLAAFGEPPGVVLMRSLEIAIPFLTPEQSVTVVNTETADLIDLNDFPMVGQSIFHMLYTIDLVRRGDALPGSTFLNLIPQAVPQFIAKMFDFERPLNDNWLLAKYYRHGGGFLAIANAYWNGGMVVMAGFTAILTAILMAIDQYFSRGRRKILATLGYWLGLPIFTIQLFYGIQGAVRILQFVSLLILYDGYRVKAKFKGMKTHV